MIQIRLLDIIQDALKMEQFCQANCWAIIALSKLGRAEEAWKIFGDMIPHTALQKIGLQRYEAEPYAYASNIIGPENKRHGWANVTQVTELLLGWTLLELSIY